MCIAWPAFLMAGVLEMLVFAVVDPSDMHWFHGPAMELSHTAIYTMAFFVFWLVIGLAGSLTVLLSVEPNTKPDERGRHPRRTWP